MHFLVLRLYLLVGDWTFLIYILLKIENIPLNFLPSFLPSFLPFLLSNERISTEPKWVVKFTTKINRIRRDIAHIELMQKCKQTISYTGNQKRIRNRLIRKYRNIKECTLTYHIKCLKQELKATSSRVNHQKKVSECKRINKLFSTNP